MYCPLWKRFALICGLALLFFMTAAPAMAFDTARDDQLLLVVNGKNPLPPKYQPADLVDIATLAPSQKSSIQLRAEAAGAYQEMLAAYQTELDRPLYSISGFRSYAYQKRLFSSKVAGRQQAGQSYAAAYNNTLLYTALPGASEHQTGLALDLSDNAALSAAFRDTAQGEWLLANCWDFGFILRYDEGKTDLTSIAYEPWHYRYVGLPHSLLIRDHGWVLEEYLAALQAEGQLACPDPADPEAVYKVYYTTDPAQEYAGMIGVSSDNAGGWLVTCRCSRLDEILTAWASMARSNDALHPWLS